LIIGMRPQNETNEVGQLQNVKMSRGEEDGPEPTQKGPVPAGGSARPLT
jgi:hypothetical protein